MTHFQKLWFLAEVTFKDFKMVLAIDFYLLRKLLLQMSHF